MGLFKIGVSIEAGAVVVQKLLTFLKGDSPLFHTFRYPYLKLSNKFLGVILHVVEHLCHGLAVDHLVDVVVAVAYTDMHGCGVAEEVVHVAENLLKSAHEEQAKGIRLGAAKAMDGKDMRVVAVGNKVGYLAVAVAGDVLDGGTTRGTLVEALDGNDGEELVDGP